MRGTISFGDGHQIETFRVVEILAWWLEPGDEAATCRVRLDRPYKGRLVVTMPADCVSWNW